MNLEHVTPSDLARELAIDAKRIRDFLRETYGLLKKRDEKRWLLTTAQADVVRRHFRE
ncbi:hypothetical protein V5R04_05740 [Jonesiaceae bacterium BS-20]|uniref:Uncharacterized protein n=1 Tax=Jonesiaceae bacterium BS-20 TaxID=3120821 RepID=A0AAU7DZM4_9MICO